MHIGKNYSNSKSVRGWAKLDEFRLSFELTSVIFYQSATGIHQMSCLLQFRSTLTMTYCNLLFSSSSSASFGKSSSLYSLSTFFLRWLE